MVFKIICVGSIPATLVINFEVLTKLLKLKKSSKNYIKTKTSKKQKIQKKNKENFFISNVSFSYLFDKKVLKHFSYTIKFNSKFTWSVVFQFFKHSIEIS